MSGPERLKRFGVAGFGTHFLVFAAAAVASLALAAATDWRWLYWVPAGWGVLLLVHYLIYKASTMNESWIERRADEPRSKSDGRVHIEGLQSDQTRDASQAGGGRDRRLP
ncbi:MAG: 2TM domain-containing protein [Alphaproteobacteria bacterium]